MKEINKVEWERTRKQGIYIYLLLNWILYAALPATIIVTFFRWLMQDRSIEFFTSGTFLDKMIATFVLLFVVSIIFGLIKWVKSEKMYKHSNADTGK